MLIQHAFSSVLAVGENLKTVALQDVDQDQTSKPNIKLSPSRGNFLNEVLPSPNISLNKFHFYPQRLNSFYYYLF